MKKYGRPRIVVTDGLCSYSAAMKEIGAGGHHETGRSSTIAQRTHQLKARPEILDRRRETVEHPFGTIMQWMNQGAFLMRGLDKVRAEFSLTALAYNLRRALNILGVERLMEAVAA
jgi:hypothetical protein